jgi:hypothetical protein
MPDKIYNRSVEQLRKHASMFWPAELSEKQAALSVIPKLIETQDDFIAILSVNVPDLTKFFNVVNSASFAGNLFVKHLIVLADFAGEMLQRINNQFGSLFPNGKLQYVWNEKKESYVFKRLPLKGSLSNTSLSITGEKLLHKSPLTNLHEDVIAILLFGSTSVDERTAQILSKCEIGNYIGQPDKLSKFIKQRYIWVSRITGGAQSNDLGHLAQTYVREYLEQHLKSSHIKIKSGHVPGITHTDEQTDRLTTFDLVVSKGDKHVAIEVGFQVTTNSVIERKAGQAKSRFEQFNKQNQKIAYVMDGVGNFQRENALATICAHSHCTVAFSKAELSVLCDFITEFFTKP